MRYFCQLIGVILLVSASARAQTSCSVLHVEPGVHLCFPSSTTLSEVPPLLHISAEINAPEGKVVSGYTIKVDDVLVGVDVERVPVPQLAVEGTLGVPLAPGPHNIRVEAGALGGAQTKVLVKPFSGTVPCTSVTNVPQWVCSARPYKGETKPASPFASLESSSNHSLSFEQFAQALLQELEALQLDSMEVAALDDDGNIYTATHALPDIEVRKYGPGGQKLEFATVISSCGPGFTALDAIALADEGQIWIAGHSTACFQPTANAVDRGSSTKAGEERSFLLRVNMSRNASPPPTYFTFLPDANHSRVTGLSVSHNGNVYIAGYTTSSTFPHQHVLSLGSRNAAPDPLSFVTILKADGSELVNSALLRGVRITALAVNDGSVAIAGTAGKAVPNQELAASCCSEILATLRTDLSAAVSVTKLPQTVSGRIQALATTNTGSLIALSYAKQPLAGSSVGAAAIRSTIYSWSAASRRPACAEGLNTSTMPAIINVPALNAYARTATPNAICRLSGKMH